MRLIILDRELHEPLTIADIPQSLFRFAQEHGGNVTLIPPPAPIAVMANGPDFNAAMITFKSVTLSIQCVADGRGKSLFWFAYPDDPETALLLRTAFLPGQVGEVLRRESEAFFRGVLAAGRMR